MASSTRERRKTPKVIAQARKPLDDGAPVAVSSHSSGPLLDRGLDEYGESGVTSAAGGLASCENRALMATFAWPRDSPIASRSSMSIATRAPIVQKPSAISSRSYFPAWKETCWSLNTAATIPDTTPTSASGARSPIRGSNDEDPIHTSDRCAEDENVNKRYHVYFMCERMNWGFIEG